LLAHDSQENPYPSNKNLSSHSIEAIEEWGILKGTWLGIKRIARCHPWGTSGYDPIPKKSDRPK
jgi:putative component of membrane protein insertase Oxa1/YidC/SpoIIIJ protein YidD